LLGRRVALGRGAWVLSLGAAIGCAPASGEAVSFVDGARLVGVERVGVSDLDGLPDGVSRVELRYPGRPGSVAAGIDATAVVRLAPGADLTELRAVGARPVRALMPSIGLWLVEDAEGGDGLDVATRLRSEHHVVAGVVEAMPNLYLAQRPLEEYTPDDPRLGGQWYFENLRMTEAWGLTQGDAAHTIVVVDTGCDLAHPDLAAKMDPGLDVVDADADPTPDASEAGAAHGTECAGVAAAATDNGEGIAGACPACRLRCVRLLTDVIQPISTTVDAYQFALEVDASIVSNSWGYVEAVAVPQSVADSINAVFENGRGGRGALVLFAAGNDDREIQDDELQAVTGVLGIGAINNFDEQTPFTNFGNAVDLVAPTGTLTTDISGAAGDDPGDYTSNFGGTSSACPVAAGIAGLLVSAAPELTSAELYEVMIRTARPAPFAVPDENGHDPVYGFGIIEPVAALEDVLGVGAEGGGGGAGGGGNGGQGGSGAVQPTAGGDEPADDGGCGCQLPGAARAGSPAVLYALLALAARRRRKRR
jgi:subtilisin family serine protease